MIAAFVFFAFAVILCLIGALVYLYPGARKVSTVPGMDPSDEREGNLLDIACSGSLHEYLIALHGKYGPIASFWMGTQNVISIASPELFSQHSHVFDRPVALFKMFEPLISLHSIQFANGADGQKRRRQYDSSFSHDVVVQSVPDFVQNAEGTVKKWESLLDEQHIPLGQNMKILVMNSIVHFMFGDVTKTDKEILEFSHNYEKCWAEMELSLTEGLPVEGTQRHKEFHAALTALKDTIRHTLSHCQQNESKGGKSFFVDRLLSNGESDEVILADAITYLVGGYHTTTYTLMWCLYFLASHPKVQEKAYKSIRHDLGDEPVSSDNVFNLTYLKQCLNETLRCAVIAPYGARVQDHDSELGGHKITKNTPVLHAIGVVLKDPNLWPKPDEFDPERFSAENEKRRPAMAFQPFGFAGKRKCPGYRLATCEVLVYLAVLLTNFKISLVPGQVVTPVYGLVGRPEEEIWITVASRRQQSVD